MGIYFKILAVAAALMGFAAMLPSKDACAQSSTIAPQTCDTQVWTAMAQRARLETEREIMQNQNLIFKPDSVLAYTCFDSFAAHAASQVGVLFTHTNYWGGSPIIPWGTGGPGGTMGLDAAIDQVVLDSMREYYQGNFPHGLLGGRPTNAPGGQPGGGSGGQLPIGHTVTAQPSSTSTYSCDVMGQVWSVAKCLNFLHNEGYATDGFFPFADLQAVVGQDVAGMQTIIETRAWPTACGRTGQLGGTSWEDFYRESRNETAFGVGSPHYDYQDIINQTFSDVRDMIEPAASCANPIPTGVTVILSPGATGDTHPDGVCTTPGCALNSDGTRCVASASTPRVGGP